MDLCPCPKCGNGNAMFTRWNPDEQENEAFCRDCGYEVSTTDYKVMRAYQRIVYIANGWEYLFPENRR